ncbi:MAG: hypothetical protein FJY07_09010 [Bacteroidetes bacterium]|nr:hypothetical protein [Bacteroidota bacterium]
MEIGVFAGGSYYMGDLNPNVPFLQTNLAYGALVRYATSSRWAVRVNLYKGILAGDDTKSNFLPERSLKFNSSIWEMGGVGEFNFLPYFTGSMKNYFTPYLFGGAALLYHRPKVGRLDLRDFNTEGQEYATLIYPMDPNERKYSYFSFSIPFGVGVKYSFSKRIAATIEWGMRKTFTDYIDDVSTTYYFDTSNPDLEPPEDLEYSDPNLNHDAKMQRGNSQNDDWYSFAGLTLTYYINMKDRNKCSDFENKY